MKARYIDGPLTEDKWVSDDDPLEPRRYRTLPETIPGLGLYVLDHDRTFGPSAAALHLDIPDEWPDDESGWEDWTEKDWNRYERERAEKLELLKQLQEAARTKEDGEYVAFYRYTADPEEIYRVLDGRRRGYKATRANPAKRVGPGQDPRWSTSRT